MSPQLQEKNRVIICSKTFAIIFDIAQNMSFRSMRALARARVVLPLLARAARVQLSTAVSG